MSSIYFIFDSIFYKTYKKWLILISFDGNIRIFHSLTVSPYYIHCYRKTIENGSTKHCYATRKKISQHLLPKPIFRLQPIRFSASIQIENIYFHFLSKHLHYKVI